MLQEYRIFLVLTLLHSVPADLQSAGLELGICNPLCVTDFHVASFLLAKIVLFLICKVFRIKNADIQEWADSEILPNKGLFSLC